MEQNVLEKPNKKVILLGNEAIVRGALEAGVQFVSTYPGTPASEIGDTFFRIFNSKVLSFYFEYSTNEKVAMEAGVGASFSGLKTLVVMKDFGLNVCLDALFPFCYTGTKGPTVIVVADDPSCHSSAQSEQNTRGFAELLHIPVLEPSDSQECKDFIKIAFEISEKFKIPVLLRTTTRVNHQAGLVKLGKLLSPKGKAKFVKDVRKFNTLPPRVLEMHQELLDKIAKIQEFSEKSQINKISGGLSSAKLGIITSGVSYLYVMEALKELKISLPVLKLGFFYPLSKKKINNFIKPLKKVLIVEESEPFLEKEIKILAKEINCKLKVVGKELLPEVGELKPGIVIRALAKFTNSKFKIQNLFKIQNSKFKIPKRRPQLCPGCPYWLVFGAIKKAVNEKDVIFGGDIGCYMLAGVPPHNIQDYLFCMGSSIGIAHGIKKAVSGKQKLITFIGDSTFFHAGIPALINAVHNQSNPLIIILDNQTTAMTGHQPHPGIKIDAAPIIKPEDIIRACQIKHLKIIDPIKQKEFIQTIQKFLKKDEVSVIIARRPCKFVK
jgi:indolepyruvate ferredoxin oxidoreductase alpha subunit